MDSMMSSLTRRTLLVALPLLVAACGGGEGAPEAGSESDAAAAATEIAPSLGQLLADGASIFGTFSGPMTPEQGAAIVSNRDADFILYSMESGPFDLEAMAAYLEGMEQGAAAAGVTPQPVLLRTPAIHTNPEVVPGQAAAGLEVGAAGIVFPHVQTADEAAATVAAMGDPWPLGEAGVNVLIVEDQEGIANVREIMATEGLSVVFAGPGDLRRAYEGDMEAVENAIQTVLAACLEFDVACGVTAGVDDIGARLDEGFRVIIVTEQEALAVGRAHVGR
jgi:4-hydroxy-2-oxoheptanedioate aldolase